MAPLAVQYPSTSTLESRREGGGDGNQDQVPLPLVISSAVDLCQNHGQFDQGRSLDTEQDGDRGLTNRLILISNGTRTPGRSCQYDLSQTNSQRLAIWLADLMAVRPVQDSADDFTA